MCRLLVGSYTPISIPCSFTLTNMKISYTLKSLYLCFTYLLYYTLRDSFGSHQELSSSLTQGLNNFNSFSDVIMCFQVVTKRDLLALYLSGTYYHRTSKRPPSCIKPWQLTMYANPWILVMLGGLRIGVFLSWIFV